MQPTLTKQLHFNVKLYTVARENFNALGLEIDFKDKSYTPIMKKILINAALLVVTFTACVVTNAKCHDLQNFSATQLRSSEKIDFCENFNGKAMLVVNTASQCGFTSQFKDLEALHQQYGEQLAIVGFPSNDFHQEHVDTEKVANVCYLNYGVTFTMLEPSNVTGKSANALFKALGERSGEQPSWNFNKYLISADGSKVSYFPANVKPTGEKMLMAITSMLETK